MSMPSLLSQVPMRGPNGYITPTLSRIPNAPHKDKINDALFNPAALGARVHA